MTSDATEYEADGGVGGSPETVQSSDETGSVQRKRAASETAESPQAPPAKKKRENIHLPQDYYPPGKDAVASYYEKLEHRKAELPKISARIKARLSKEQKTLDAMIGTAVTGAVQSKVAAATDFVDGDSDPDTDEEDIASLREDIHGHLQKVDIFKAELVILQCIAYGVQGDAIPSIVQGIFYQGSSDTS